MSRGWKTLVSCTLIAATLGLLGYWVADDWDNLRAIPWWDRPGLIALHLAIQAAAFWLLVRGWQAVLRGMGYGCSPSLAAWSWLVPNLGKYLPGKVLMFAGRIELCRIAGVPRGVAFAALVLEHLLLILAAMPFLTVALLSTGAVIDLFAMIGLGVAIGVGSALLLRPKGLRWLLVRLGRWSGQLTAMPDEGLALRLLPLYLGIWTSYGLSGLVLIHALGFSAAIPGLAGVAAFVAAWVIGFLSLVTPGGLGVREAALVGLLSPFVTVSEASALALVARVTWTGVEMIGVLVGAWLGLRGPDPIAR
jgi:uncharacterized membrane protein YbhN (UPF0104 family)